MIVAGAAFIASFLIGIWPKACLDKAKRLLAAKGEDPNQTFGFAKIQELDRRLAQQYRTGLALSTVGWLVFMVFTMLAVFGR